MINVAEELSKDTISQWHKRLLDECYAFVRFSRTEMSRRYVSWDKFNNNYRGIAPFTETDALARARKEPERFIVPVTYSQVQTFASFCHSLYYQRDNIFELEGFTPEDVQPAKIGEALLGRDLDNNKFKARLWQFLIDIARYGFGVMKVMWSTERRQRLVPNNIGNVPSLLLNDGITHQGNVVVNISPYRFYPDVRLPLTRFQEGEFCASEEVYGRQQLRLFEKDGACYGTEYIPQFTRQMADSYNLEWDLIIDPTIMGGSVDLKSKRVVVLTEVQRSIIPAEYDLGPEEFPVKYVFWIGNGSRLVKVEPLNYPHDEFTYIVGTYGFDQSTPLPDGLCDIIEPLQTTITWLINARITNVRKIVNNHLVVDPAAINMDDLLNRKPIIRLNKGFTQPERFVMPLNIQDVTVNHVTDAKFLQDVVQTVTGINETMLGQYAPTRRSATEHRNVLNSSVTRLKTIAEIIYDLALEPMARQMLANLRTGLTEETYIKLGGTDMSFIGVTKEDLEGDYDFKVFDGTLPSERNQTAATLVETLGALLQNPEAAQAYGVNVAEVLKEVLYLRGIRNPERFINGGGQGNITQGTEGVGEQPVLPTATQVPAGGIRESALGNLAMSANG